MSSTPLGILRPLADKDLARMLQWRNAPAIRKNMFTRNEISPEEHAAWWQRTHQRADQHYFVYEQDAIPAGIVAFNGVDRVNAHSFWAFYAAPEAPRGTGSRMEFLALEHAFGALGLHKLSCEVLASNVAVIRLHLKFGFSEEGVFRSHHYVDDTYVAVHRLGILAEEWQQHRSAMLARLAGRE